MRRKQNEEELGKMMRKYGFYTRKSRDRGYISCPQCHKTITKCPHCGGDMLLNKAETLPDFIIAFDYIYVEGKGATDSWNWKSSIRPNQDKICAEHESWLFLEMGTGRAPNGRSAWLVPWKIWKGMQAGMELDGFSSMIYQKTERSRNPVAGEVLAGWEMAWETGGWSIPEEHPFWKKHPQDGQTKTETENRNVQQQHSTFSTEYPGEN